MWHNARWHDNIGFVARGGGQAKWCSATYAMPRLPFVVFGSTIVEGPGWILEMSEAFRYGYNPILLLCIGRFSILNPIDIISTEKSYMIHHFVIWHHHSMVKIGWNMIVGSCSQSITHDQVEGRLYMGGDSITMESCARLPYGAIPL